MTRPHPAESIHAFAAFGGILAADRDLPGLPLATAGSPSSWVLRTRDLVAPHAPASASPVLGRVAVADGITLTLQRDGDAHLLTVSDTGRYRIDDRTIDHQRPEGADPSAVALDVIGHVLPLLLHRTGAWVLHASAITTPAGAIALVGPRGAGKSTLAAACTALGAQLVADDATVITMRDRRPLLLPAGLPLRVRPDVADALATDAAPATADDGWGKRRLAVTLAPAQPIPLAAIAFVHPITGGDAQRHDLAPRQAVPHLAAAGKLAALLGAEDAVAALDRAATLAAAVPLRRLDIPRDLARLRAVARWLLDGAGAPVAA
ncbi:MAG: hypothetical protein MUF21_13060 [Gemmatimonadaceae bacterium]|nr:hypothetical protein [Gemmatimonadaceae bacterium]